MDQPINKIKKITIKGHIENNDFSVSESEWECEYLEEIEEYRCQICRDVYLSIESLKSHIERDHCQFSCPNCNKRYFKESQLNTHLRNAHLASLNLQCKICDKLFKTKYNLQQHIITHSTNPVFKCSYKSCNKKFRHVNSYRQHKDVHLEKNRKECLICHQNVTRLSIHLLRHSNEKPFKCDKCEKQFITEQDFLCHKFTTHWGGRFKCETCIASFKNISSLYKHRKAIHFQENFACPRCNKNFNRKDNLIVHARNFHGIELNTKSQLRKIKEKSVEKKD